MKKKNSVRKHSKYILIIGALGVIAFAGWNTIFAEKLSNCLFWKSKDKWTNCFGKQKMTNGVYEGQYLNGKFNGQGTFTYNDGDEYVGEYKNGKRHGLGTYTFDGQKTSTYNDGYKYVGAYKDDKRHGQWTYTWTDGTVKKDIWENGKFIERTDF